MRRFFLFSVIALVLPWTVQAAFGDTNTFSSQMYFGDGQHRKSATFDFPYGFVQKKSGAFIIADTHNNVIRTITRTGKVKTLAGTGTVGSQDGARQSASFYQPRDVTVKKGVVVVADTGNGAIRKIANGHVTTLTTGAGHPQGVVVRGKTVFFTDTHSNSVKKVPLAGGSVQTVSTRFGQPEKIELSKNKKYAFVTDSGSRVLRRVHLSSGRTKVIAGSGAHGSKDGDCAAARFASPNGVHVLKRKVYVADHTGSVDKVRRVDLDGCTVTTLTSDDDTFSVGFPRDLTGNGKNVYMLMTGFSRIEKFRDEGTPIPTHFAGRDRFNVKKSNPVLFGRPKYFALSRNKKTLYVAENNRIRKIRFGAKSSSGVVAGSVIDNYAQSDDQSYVKGFARFSDITAMDISPSGRFLYVVDRNNNRIRKVNIQTGAVSYVTGAGDVNSSGADNGKQNGFACPNEQQKNVDGCAYFNRPMGGVLSKNGKYLYVADAGNNSIRRVTLRAKRARNIGRVKTIAGTRSAGYRDGTGTQARFSAPIGITRNKKGTALFVADRNNHVIRKINLRTRAVTTVAGTPGHNGYREDTLRSAVFSFPEWITRGPDRTFYVSSIGSDRIRRIDLNSGQSTLVSGSGTRGLRNGTREQAQYHNPRGLIVRQGKLYVADMLNDLIRVVDLR